ncbi:nitroreductase family deazaflavin-dependent oxidoreductase [Hamadaea sp. NPDC050747]|uniref:nitroreductase family deazaflavin-dependent oxidoreductase n=1 Tax=Hamadaea sp. NPDC050747 TaxID=3155789 RepID=UPI0033C39E51
MEIKQRPRRPSGLRRWAFRLPILLYRLRLGAFLGSRFVLINHIGRKTGQPRQTVVEVVSRADNAVTVAAGFGPGSDWYRNLLVHPSTTIQLGSHHLAVQAHRIDADARAEAMLDYAHRHPGAARKLTKFMGYTVDGSDADYAAVGRALHMLRFQPGADHS